MACEIKRNIFGYFLPVFKANANRKLFVRERATSFTVWRCFWILCYKFTKIIQTHLTLSLTAICHTARGLIEPSERTIFLQFKDDFNDGKCKEHLFVVRKEPSLVVQMNREFPKMKKKFLTYQRAHLKELFHELYWEFDDIYG
jgi:hypothetical protein